MNGKKRCFVFLISAQLASSQWRDGGARQHTGGTVRTSESLLRYFQFIHNLLTTPRKSPQVNIHGHVFSPSFSYKGSLCGRRKTVLNSVGGDDTPSFMIYFPLVKHSHHDTVPGTSQPGGNSSSRTASQPSSSGPLAPLGAGLAS